MESYSIFSSSTNSSPSRSSPSSNFPFSLSQVSSTSNSLNLMDHHTYQDHDRDRGENQSGQLIDGLMLMGGNQQLIQPPMVVQTSNHHLMNDYQDDHGSHNNVVIIPNNDNINHHKNKDDQNKRINTVNGNNNNKLIKKGSLEKKVKKHRYAFQTRSHVDILDDGYRWRKYGQKAVKNNKFPRSYYRCTYQGCNVKKQVQRLSNDEGVVITTYEGIHSHSIERSTDNFEHILSQMQIYTSL
ncbi:putative WRKY transcription factor 75 [Bienertia sinuspersici]